MPFFQHEETGGCVKAIHFKETKFGFEYGAAKVFRFSSDYEKGCVTLGIKTKKQSIQVYVTKTGKIRVHDSTGKEWLPR